jgi:hypothetical protein
MSRQEYFTGDTRPVTVTVTTDGLAEPISGSATVSVAFVSGPTVSNGPWSAISTTPGANWNSGIVVVIPSNVATPGDFDIEVQVTEGSEVWTRRTRGKPIRVVDDAIA